jgi:hypothetical protein
LEHDASSLFSEEMWPVASMGGFGAMQVLPGTGPKVEILRVLGDVLDERGCGALAPELSKAVDALRALGDEDRVGFAYGGTEAGMTAAVALHRLGDAIAAYAEDAAPTLAPLNEYLSDSGRLRDDLANAIENFIDVRVGEEVRRLQSFSLILFRDTDADGAILDSLVNHRAAWRSALTPIKPAATDLHLALIPPPGARDAVDALADELGCSDKLPCVVFLGTEPTEALRTPPRLIRWSARGLTPPMPSVPDQLADIYSTVYGAGVVGPMLWAASGRKFVAFARERIDGRTVLQLVAGAFGGSVLLGAVNTVLDVVKRAPGR